MTFEEFVDVRLGVLLRYATVVACDEHLAQDLVQEVLIRSHARWSRISAMDQPEAYLKRMVLNQFLSLRRRWAARVTPMAELAEDAAGQLDPGGAVDERDDLMRRIAGLPPKQRAVIALSYYEDFTDVEIAEVLGCGEGTVRSHRSRALAALRVSLAPPPEPPPGLAPSIVDKADLGVRS